MSRLNDNSPIQERYRIGRGKHSRPFLRWAGSKRFALSRIAQFLPDTYGRYYEPFLGGGSLFFFLQPANAVLSDECAELIETFRAVSDNASSVLHYLRLLKPNRKLFYKIRKQRSKGRFKRAAEFIYLNKTCWNGLYRVNSKGEFNVPFGQPSSNTLADPVNLRSCSRALNAPYVKLEVSDFQEPLADAQRGDLVYLDPPYVTGHSNNSFIDYNEVLFSWLDQERLADVAQRLRTSGVYVIVTNADHPKVRRLYKGFRAIRLERYSTLAADPTRRRPVSETLFVP